MAQQNPFFLTPVLKSLANILDHSELKSCRLVCSSWDSVFQSKLVLTSKVTVESSSGFSNDLSNLLEHYVSTNSIFFSSLVLRLAEILEPSMPKLIVDVCSAYLLTEVHLEEMHDELEITFDQMMYIFQELGRNLVKCTMPLPTSQYPMTNLCSADSEILFPKLKTLRLIGYLYSRGSYTFFNHSQKELKEFFTELFRNTPQLHEITIEGMGVSGPSSALEPLDNSQCAANLTRLEISGDMDAAGLIALESLVRKARGLKILKLFYWVKREEADTCRIGLTNLMKSRSPTLQELHIYGLDLGGYDFKHVIDAYDFRPHDANWFLRREHFDGLKVIKLLPRFECNLSRFVGGVHPIRYCKTIIGGIRIEREPETKITLGYFGASGELIAALARCFPETASLKGKIVRGFEPLWAWSSLKTLKILLKPQPGDDDVNMGLLGITESTLRFLQRYLSPTKVETIEIVHSADSILNLTGLRTLHIILQGEGSLDPTAYFALAKMTWLEKLFLSGNPKLSSYCASYIRTKLENTDIVIHQAKSPEEEN